MKRSTKRVVGWGAGVAVGVVLVLLTFILVAGISGGNTDGGAKGHSMEMVNNITPHAGGDEAVASGEQKSCGNYDGWIGHKVSNSALKKTGKPFRILPPDSMMTMDHNPQRINVHVDENGIIEDVKCG